MHSFAIRVLTVPFETCALEQKMKQTNNDGKTQGGPNFCNRGA